MVKVKILIVPLALVMALGLMVWFVYPAYSVMKLQKESLKGKLLQVADLEQKDQKVKELTSSLNSNADKQQIILKYLPATQKEEEIIGSLNEIIAQEGVSVSNISVSKPKPEPIPAEVAVDANGVPLAPDPALSSQRKSKKFDAKMNIYGNYEKIKNVINKIYSLNRFNRLTGLRISHASAEAGQQASDNLLADVIFEFNFMETEKIESVADVNNKVLISGKFDTSVIEDIQRSKNVNVLNITIDSMGRTNPFLP